MNTKPSKAFREYYSNYVAASKSAKNGISEARESLKAKQDDRANNNPQEGGKKKKPVAKK